MVPGEIYPESGLRLISIKCENPQLFSKELCCGTHVTNTQEIEYFCITNLRQTNRARFSFTAVAGGPAENVCQGLDDEYSKFFKFNGTKSVVFYRH